MWLFPHIFETVCWSWKCIISSHETELCVFSFVRLFAFGKIKIPDQIYTKELETDTFIAVIYLIDFYSLYVAQTILSCLKIQIYRKL